MEVADDGNEAKSNKLTINRSVNNDQNTLSGNRKIKRVMLSLTKPSYTLGLLGFDNVRVENRRKLRYFLRKFVRRHNWGEASGVLSVILKGTGKETCPFKNRNKYLVTMELLKRMKKNSINPTKIQHVYEIWMRRIGTMKNWPVKDRFMVRLEFILFCLAQGNNEDANQAIMCLMQERDFGNDPISNMVVGLTYCQLWYSSIPTEMQLRYMNEASTPSQSEMSRTRLNIPAENSMRRDAADNHEADSSIKEIDILEADSRFQCDSDTSVRIDKDIALDRSFKAQGFYMNTGKDSEHERSSFSNCGDNNMQYASIFYAHGLDPWLLPLRMPHTNGSLEDFKNLFGEMRNDYYNNAVKYLRLAVYSTPPLLEALLPLIQMLLLGDQVKEALKELEKFGSNSEAVLPLRLKARLLEQFNRNNYIKLSTCLEDVLKKDPTCSHSLARLIGMHQNGEYSPEELLEMIALHLDATYGECNTWKEFASCFLKLSQCEEDRMSMCLDGNEGGTKQGYSVRYNRVPKILTDAITGKSWRFRCRWWLTRHFSPNTLKSELASGDLELLAYKAASASHLYGQACEYVVKAYTCLEEKDRDLFSFLQRHMLNSLGVYSNCVQ